MTSRSRRVLYASRAWESSHTEGGFLVLKDLAVRAANQTSIESSFLSCRSGDDSEQGVALLPAYRQAEWGYTQALQFAKSINRNASDFDIVHTAHVPTFLNSTILARVKQRLGSNGPRFVQTVTAIEQTDDPHPGRLWGDAVVCLNETAAAVVSQVHDNVYTIPPIPSAQRLIDRETMPAEIRNKLEGKRVICIPVDFDRLGATIDLGKICQNLLQEESDLAVVFACRFGDEQKAEKTVSGLPQHTRDGVFVFGTVNWMLDLLSISEVVLYPIENANKKFNPPLVLAEAASLGARVVASSAIALDVLGRDAVCRAVTSMNTDDWCTAALEILQHAKHTPDCAAAFEASFSQYLSLYSSLLDLSEQ